MKLLEYLAYGLTIVSTNPGGWTHLIRDHNLGILTDESAESLAKGIVQATKEYDLVKVQPNKNREFVKTHFNWETSAELLVREYKSLIR
jgi:glycosyltransferase involved in cell wall biosynthesis